MNRIFVHAISFYQRFISPYKGFRCAAGAYYGSGSCSHVVKEIIEENGLIIGRSKIRDQFRRCTIAARALQAEKKKKKRRRERSPKGEAAGCLAEAACWSCAFWQ
jgi:putative component of membrane protein insertase Oxa1/YidC/SpoIIIJ protein YidD